jgi:beta-phosphoglucomutase-like phosphatase (HAD superfamily)
VLAALGIGQRLPILVIGAELARSKPDPLPYLTALERTGALASRSLAFEDSLSGVRSAAAAGLAVVGMTTTLDSRTLIDAGAALTVSDFTDRRIFELIEARLGADADERKTA